MAVYAVRSGAAGSADGSDWTNAFLTLAAALAVATSADRIWVADDHAESTTSAINLVFPSTPGLQVLCADQHTTWPPTATGTGASLTIGAASVSLTLRGAAFVKGLTFNSATNPSVLCSILVGAQSGVNSMLRFKECTFNIRTNDINARLKVGQEDGTATLISWIQFYNCRFKFGGASQSVQLNKGRFRMEDFGFVDASGSTPTSLFTFNSSTGAIAELIGSDLSAESFTNLAAFANSAVVNFTLIDCKMPAGANLTTGSPTTPGAIHVKAVNCDSGDTNYKYWSESPTGSVKTETTIKRTGGASDGTTGQSLKVQSTSLASYPTVPHEADIEFWNETIGSPVTCTVEVVHDSAGGGTGGRFLDSELSLHAEYLGTSGFPLGAFVDDGPADILATPADQADSSETWTTTGLSSPVKQALSVTFTPQEVGWVRLKVKLFKPSATVYICHKPTVA
jgi:hypothetical protein